ncbi:1,4-dihydroxy-2-naphthoyl-CoA hydrolase [Rubripirellula reticaptiva]|uniref:1,4-dihydroxy-2-naphthoyl-CoA hydrolase n=2 Tax=Rubripirellula reticaptiva TaxID=2528013 RepID=A0A5C6ERP2_9BACT|nr:1,4-dihydroxy-2-naphthoyl-CoA hydrolase [Rubripirellula reticaptiva]
MMESAEHEMLRSMGISVFPKSAPNEHPLSWPRVSASCDYLSAAQFEDLLRIDVHVAQIGNSSVTYRFKFTRDEVVVAEGSLTVVCCLLTPKGLSKTPIPAELRELFQKHL